MRRNEFELIAKRMLRDLSKQISLFGDIKQEAKCSWCGKETLCFAPVNGNIMCADCLSQLSKHECVSCCEVIEPRAIKHETHDGPICNTCAHDETKYKVCCRCEILTPVAELKDGYCLDCQSELTSCQSCGCLYDSEESTAPESLRNVYCDQCAADRFVCPDCGTFADRSDAHYSRSRYGHDVHRAIEENQAFCWSCWTDKHNVIHNYSYKPTPKFKKCVRERRDPALLYMGIELEIDKASHASVNREATAEYLKSCSADESDFYLKDDGSLTSAGIEIVSHPRTLNSWMRYKDSLGDIFNKLVNAHSYRSHNALSSCGLHVHVNRASFNSDRQYISRLIYIINKYWEELVKFSRRTRRSIDQYARNYAINPSAQPNNTLDRLDTYGRYFALNIVPRNTIEFRVFRGTLNIDTFMACLQFIQSLCDIVRDCTSNEATKEILWNDIITKLPEEQSMELRAYAPTRLTVRVAESNEADENEEEDW